MFIYDSGKWYGNKDKYSRSTSKQYSQLHPLTDGVQYFDTADMESIAYRGFIGLLTKRLTGRSFVSEPQGECNEQETAYA
jgi:hypothetical protein